MKKKRSATCFVRELKVWFPMTLSVAVLSMYNEGCQKNENVF